MKTDLGHFFEDFYVGRIFHHATPRTITAGDQALYISLYNSRFAIHCSVEFARSLGFATAPIDDLLIFNIIFGKTVSDISLNAVANLGYADCRFLKPVFPGDTLHARSEIIGLRENANARTGIVYVRSAGFDQSGDKVLEFVRWVMVNKRDDNAPAPDPLVPDLPKTVSPDSFPDTRLIPDMRGFDFDLSGSPCRWDDYKIGERIDHMDGVTIDDAGHMMATRSYQNTARVHFNAQAQKQTKFKKPLVYGGHIISLARALSFNGLANGFPIAAINGGTHLAACFAGDTIYAFSEIKDKAVIGKRPDLGALRIRTVATRDVPAGALMSTKDPSREMGVVLDLDYWVLMPR